MRQGVSAGRLARREARMQWLDVELTDVVGAHGGKAHGARRGSGKVERPALGERELGFDVAGRDGHR